jgi:hypothetical protein
MRDLLQKYELPQVDLLKVDVEGSEKIIFGHPGAAAWLPRVEMILVETHDWVDPGCSQAVTQAVAGLFNFCGYRGEYALYMRSNDRDKQKRMSNVCTDRVVGSQPTAFAAMPL